MEEGKGEHIFCKWNVYVAVSHSHSCTDTYNYMSSFIVYTDTEKKECSQLHILCKWNLYLYNIIYQLFFTYADANQYY